jgi:YegS/Rv2252/BmrU family lipid kinase
MNARNVGRDKPCASSASKNATTVIIPGDTVIKNSPKSASRTTFILNPRSGKLGGKKNVLRWIDRVWGQADRDYEILITTRRGEGTRLTKNAVAQGSDLVVAVGGDGTLNEVIQGALGSEVPVGLVPAGSGNGFARHWGIPLNPETACKGLLNPRLVKCDIGKADGHYFTVTFGCGLDAALSRSYARSRFRGMTSYFLHGVFAFFAYRPRLIVVEAEGKVIYEGKPLLLTFANAKGYGGGTVIAPLARMDDGLLDLCIVEPLPLKDSLLHLRDLFGNGIESIPTYRRWTVREAVLKRLHDGPIHVDGDPFDGAEEITVSVIPRAISFALPT